MSYQEFRISSWDIRLGIRLSHGDIPNVMDSHWADQEMPVIHSISFDSTEEELVVTAPSAAATSAEAATPGRPRLTEKSPKKALWTVELRKTANL